MSPQSDTVRADCRPRATQAKRMMETCKRREEGTGKTKTKNPAYAGFKIGRRERIRTSDPLVPNQLRYQAALLAEILLFELSFNSVFIQTSSLE